MGGESYMSYCSDITKNRILECAKGEFLSKGFENAKVAEIAKLAKVTTGALYQHFKNKEDLYDCIVSPICNGFISITNDRNKDFIDSLERDEFSIISEELSYITNDLLKYIYDNWKIFRILILNDKTKIYKTFFNTIVENETKMTQLMIEKKNIRQYEHLTFKKLKSLISAQYQGIFALMRTEDDIKNLDNDLHLLFDFFRYGWIGVLGI